MSPKLVAALSVVTLGAVAWFTLLNGGSDSSSNDVSRVQSQFQKSVVAITTSGNAVHSSQDLIAFNATCDKSLPVITSQIAVLRRIAEDESDEARTVATDARNAAQRGYDAARAYCSALGQFRLADAQHAHQDLDAASQDLDRQIKNWGRL